MNDDINNDADNNKIDLSDKAGETAQGENELEKIKKEIEELRKTNEEYLAGWKRAKADYVNLEAQSGKRLNIALERELADAVLRFLPIYETFSKALEHIEETPDETRQGLEAALGEFWKTFKDLGVEKIKIEGAADPNIHEVIMRQKKEGFESDRIIQEAASGYTLNGKLLRAAKVIVAE
ncbi:nucleotide exchange factor GrpE [Patescibacteria group bacterium]|nr:MAG: nucleotide exchange factor GrpE [Patescibacteria group bacterium]